MRLADQMERLFNSTVQMSYRDEHGAGTVGLRVANRTQFWWDPKRPRERALWQSTIELSAAMERKPCVLASGREQLIRQIGRSKSEKTKTLLWCEN